MKKTIKFLGIGGMGTPTEPLNGEGSPLAATATNFWSLLRKLQVLKLAGMLILITVIGLSMTACFMEPPDTPTGVRAEVLSATSVKISWDAVSGADGYTIYRASGTAGSLNKWEDVTGTSYTDTGLTTGTTYRYSVTAYNAFGESEQSAVVFTTPAAAFNADAMWTRLVGNGNAFQKGSSSTYAMLTAWVSFETTNSTKVVRGDSGNMANDPLGSRNLISITATTITFANGGSFNYSLSANNNTLTISNWVGGGYSASAMNGSYTRLVF